MLVFPVQAEDMKHEVGIGYASAGVDGQDSGFTLGEVPGCIRQNETVPSLERPVLVGDPELHGPTFEGSHEGWKVTEGLALIDSGLLHG